MKNKYIIGVIVIVAIAILNYVLFQFAVEDAVDLIEVPFANRIIYPHEQIGEDDIEWQSIPSYYVRDNAFLEKEDIIGKYVDLQSKLAKGQLFYKDMLFSLEDANELPALLLHDGQTAFPLAMDLVKSSGGTLSVNQKVDVYVTIYDAKTKQTSVDCLLRNARIISVKDRSGLNMYEEKAASVPSVCVIAVADEYVDLLRKAEKVGVINIYAPRADYDHGEESVLNEESIVLPMLQS